MTALEHDQQRFDTSFEIDLGDEPDPGRAPVYVDVVTRDHERRPIIPATLRGVDNVKAAGRRAAGRAGHTLAYHAVRSPLYIVLAAFWALVGVGRLVGRQLRWWWVLEQHALRQDAATRNDDAAWLALHREARSARLWRGSVLGAELVAVVAAGLALYLVAPWWVQAVAVAVVVPVLARVGRPVGKPIVSAAVVTPRFNTGSEVVVDLPYGARFADVVKAKTSIASGLDVTDFQVFLTADKTSERRHRLFVADVNPLGVPAGRSPLLDCRPRSVWRSFPLGLDERGRRVLVDLLWHSYLVGAQPRKGKTFTARAIALFAALDPFTKLFIVDGKNSPDWRKFALVAERMIYGVAANRDGDPVDDLLGVLRLFVKHIEAVNDQLSTLPISECPEGKLTEQLARDPRYPDLRVWVLVMEEFQVYFETVDQEANKEVAQLLARILAQGPSAGVILLSSSQKPSGVGAGDVGRLFNRYRDNHDVRFALRCGNRIVSEAVLGGDAYAEGYDASSLPVGPEFRGIGYLYGLTDDTPLVRTYLADAEDAERILLAARRHREAAGTLSGMAAGEDVARVVRDPLADARGVFYAGEARISWPELAARLGDRLPEHYAEVTPDAVSALLRGLGVPGKSVRDPKWFEKGVGQGCTLDAIDAAAAKRAVSA
ncbi:cell division protein FtsK [Dactylosporangium sp. NBC_01737]|uniref:cell division protein FtsK n=1 Tax=Dactylosporangium sp. NBC_01737 TaxID=2975959 RepID=UPI002E0E46B3|nr:cell division protein FtsK [Dactylosporangium sp. NBC_01737]